MRLKHILLYFLFNDFEYDYFFILNVSTSDRSLPPVI